MYKMLEYRKIEPLEMQPCRAKYKKSYSTKEHSPFRPIPARGGPILHPYVLSIPDIPQVDDDNDEEHQSSRGRTLIEAYNLFFGHLTGMDRRDYLSQSSGTK